MIPIIILDNGAFGLQQNYVLTTQAGDMADVKRLQVRAAICNARYHVSSEAVPKQLQIP